MLPEVLVGEPRWRRSEVAEAAGVPLEFADRLWAAMGLPRITDDSVTFTDADVAALRAVVELCSRWALDQDEVVQLARSAGQLVTRLAESHVQAMQAYVNAEAATPAPPAAVSAVLDTVADLITYVWRRQVAAAARGYLAGGAAGGVTLAVGFVDLVGFTALSRELPPGELSALLERFEARAAEIVSEHGARIVKTVGDAVLWVADDARTAASVGLALVEAEPGTAGAADPPLRGGLAYGPVLPRLGDVYGPVVNLASRLCGLARPGSLLVDREAARALREHPDLTVHPLRRQSVRGYDALAAYRVRAVPAGGPDSGA